MQRHEYTLHRDESNLGRHFGVKKPDFAGFYELICSAGINKAFYSDKGAQEWAKVVYKNVESPQIIVITGKAGHSTVYSGSTLLLQVRDNRIIKVCMPGIKSLKGTYVFCGHDYEYTLWAKFPDLEDGGENFLDYAFELKSLSVRKLKKLGYAALAYSQLPKFIGPELITTGDYFLYCNETMYLLEAPKWKVTGRGCLWENNIMDCNTQEEQERTQGNGLLFAPSLVSAGRNCHPLIKRAIEQNKVETK